MPLLRLDFAQRFYNKYYGETERNLRQALSVVMAERVAQLREWAAERTVPAA